MNTQENFKGPIIVSKLSNDEYTPPFHLKSVQAIHLDTNTYTISPCTKPISKVIDFNQFSDLGNEKVI